MLTPIHPLMGMLAAAMPDYGDGNLVAQLPSAALGLLTALVIHLAKLLLRTLGLGVLGPCIACLEHAVLITSVVLALFFGFFAIAVALVVLLSVLRWIRHKYENPGDGAAAASSINAAPLVAAKDSASQV